uniref:VWFA domain-containing protein n=1 Tax=uncultured bacterium esnapd2 TaxID=1366601 RepID=S5TK76_9BACT|nr:hypothetical protein [uncultured bacterium esnapd2]
MNTWIRRSFTSAGLTQSPPGPHFEALRARMSGTVLVCIDVSGSMYGDPLRQAVVGGTKFFDEAHKAGYRAGLILWNHGVVAHVWPDAGQERVLRVLRAAHASGGNDLVPTLVLCRDFFAERTGDRVLCVFGDGDVGDPGAAKRLARQLCAMGVRIVVRGLGRGAQEALSALVCPGETDEAQLIEDVKHIDTGIASMASGLIRRYD